MTKDRFPWVALGVGLILALVLVQSGATSPATEQALPLLTLLLISEFGFLVTAVGALLGARTLVSRGFVLRQALVVAGCTALSAGFLILGLDLWPGLSGDLSPP
ncbi:MAG: hypothetical protein PVF91_01410 [Chromatiales bacterium]|jgi:hypothetical protein